MKAAVVLDSRKFVLRIHSGNFSVHDVCKTVIANDMLISDFVGKLKEKFRITDSHLYFLSCIEIDSCSYSCLNLDSYKIPMECSLSILISKLNQISNRRSQTISKSNSFQKSDKRNLHQLQIASTAKKKDFKQNIENHAASLYYESIEGNFLNDGKFKLLLHRKILQFPLILLNAQFSVKFSFFSADLPVSSGKIMLHWNCGCSEIEELIRSKSSKTKSSLELPLSLPSSLFHLQISSSFNLQIRRPSGDSDGFITETGLGGTMTFFDAFQQLPEFDYSFYSIKMVEKFELGCVRPLLQVAIPSSSLLVEWPVNG